jgi:hypothetical protein
MRTGDPTAYELTNSFHGTKTWTTYSAERREQIDYLIASGKLDSRSNEYRARSRARRTLCGIWNCKCSNAWGER